MKHYRLNQIAMAVLGALLLIFGTRTLINIAFEEHEPEKPGMEVAGAKVHWVDVTGTFKQKKSGPQKHRKIDPRQRGPKAPGS